MVPSYLRFWYSPAMVDYVLGDFARLHLVKPVSAKALHLLALALYRLGIHDRPAALLMHAHRGAPTERITTSVVKYCANGEFITTTT